MESLVKSVKSPQDVEKLAQIYEYILSVIIKSKSESRNYESTPEMKKSIDIYLEETKNKLIELCDNKDLVNDAIEKLFRLCDAL